MTEILNNDSDKLPVMAEDKEVLIPEQVKDVSLFDNHFRKGIIMCNVWLLGKNGARDKFIGSQKRRVGKRDFVVKGKRYWINYDELKEGKKNYIFDCDVTNSIGTLSFHDLSDRKVVPNQADNMLVDGVVRLMMAKGGIPAMYLLVAMIMVTIAVVGLVYFMSQYQTLVDQNGRLTASNKALTEQLKAFLPPTPTGAK